MTYLQFWSSIQFDPQFIADKVSHFMSMFGLGGQFSLKRFLSIRDKSLKLVSLLHKGNEGIITARTPTHWGHVVGW